MKITTNRVAGEAMRPEVKRRDADVRREGSKVIGWSKVKGQGK